MVKIRGGHGLFRTAVWVVAVLSVIFIATGCTSSGNRAEPTSGVPSGSGGVVRPVFTDTSCWQPNYPGVPQLDLGSGFRCGYLTVPENRSKPSGKTIKVGVAIARAASASPQKDPLVYLAGGPGGTGIVTAVQKVAGGMNADRDVIFVDQRGEYHAEPALTCAGLDSFGSRLPTLKFFEPGTRQAAEAAVKACRDTFASGGWDLSSFNTIENAADIADLRVALGIASWNVYGVSYGTYLALNLVRDHPEGIRAVVLDSVVPPQQNIMEGFWVWPSYGYERLFDACERQPACKTAYPNLRREFTDTVSALEENPITVSITLASGAKAVVLDGYSLANALVLPSLSPGLLQDLPKAVHAMANGDGTLVANIVGGEGAKGVTSWGLAYGVFCGEHWAYTTPEQALAAAKKALPTFPDSVLSPRVTQAPTIAWDCAVWDVPKTVKDPHRTVASDIPMLVLEGTLDAVTPVENGQAVLPGLSRSQFVEIPGAGHDVILWDTKCSQPLMNAFLRDPTAVVNTSCVQGLTDPTFTTS